VAASADEQRLPDGGLEGFIMEPDAPTMMADLATVVRYAPPPLGLVF
jgi:hypothetical protein